MIWEDIQNAQEFFANKNTPGNYSLPITNSTRDNMTLRSPITSLDDHGHDDFHAKLESGSSNTELYIANTSYLSYFNYYLNETNNFVEAMNEGLDGAQAYFSDKFAHYPADVEMDRSEQWQELQIPHYDNKQETDAFNVFTLFYAFLNSQKNAFMAEGDTQEVALTKAIDSAKGYVAQAIDNDRPLSINRMLPSSAHEAQGTDTYAYFLVSGYNTEDTADALAILKNNPSIFKDTSADLLAQMGLPPEASNPDFVGSNQWNELTSNNQYYDAALVDYQNTYLNYQADNIVNSYDNLLKQIPPGDTDTKNYLEYQLELLKENPQYLEHLSLDKLTKTSNLTSQEAEALYDQIYNTPAYLSFMASWTAGTQTYTSLDEFTSGNIPSWFSVGNQSVYTSYADKIPNEIENQQLQQTLTLTQQLGIYDFTMDTLGVDGNKMFNADYDYDIRNFEDLQKVYNDMQDAQQYGEGNIEMMFMNWYRLTGPDGILLQNLYFTYKNQNIVEKVASPKMGAFYVLENKIKLALEHPEFAFNVLNVKDETGNTIAAVATTQLNSNQLAHAQALYNKNNETYKDYPPEVLQALGLNPNLSNGALQNGEDVGSNVVGGQYFTQDQVAHYGAIVDAVDNSIINNYGLIDVSSPVTTTTTVNTTLPDGQVQSQEYTNTTYGVIAGTETQAGQEAYIAQQAAAGN
jgi:hypothetical protein